MVSWNGIALVTNDQGDWIGLYDKGHLVAEGHSFEPSELLDLIGVTHIRISDVDLNPYGSRLPDQLSGLNTGTTDEN